mmetsp:Transcript_38711/g.86097  ORF Transcript_38711/g.86097 Transcript_38711/m.86097 type:complete len:277 (+) Transcript_38711:122-952(+)|eukprot:CAMPEP_0202902068 /NCGR_PEP_ID=MMETSP1392-20130828/16156_1 /ASSEMBLY_ACC=CAM_ASM_000868 /TAXON_ID=225041 /ORGANISM="Chlamydomonas chlamydogama, Strain SAG 11-48b" /LENGTH=276 /DNA_ID=CAMNT_0049588751 /DNA_START=103 /DNA_END=933 /DNA_ORIENTATION=+
MPTPAYSDIGKANKELLSGTAKAGAFQFDPKLSFTSTTSNGVSFAVNATKKGDKVDGTLKVSYAHKKYSADATVDPAGKVAVTASLSDLAPGLKFSGSAVLPDPTSAKVGLDYSFPYLTLKSSVALTSAPLVDVSASTGYKNFLLGGETAYDTAKSTVSKYNVGIGYHAADFQVAAFLTDKASTAKLVYAHNVTKSQVVGAEVVRKLSGGDTTFTLGYSKKLESGALTKVKIDNAGVLAALYETKLSTGEKVAGALQLQATDLSKPVKYGFSLDLF